MTRFVHVDYTVLKYFCSLSVWQLEINEASINAVEVIKHILGVWNNGTMQHWLKLIIFNF